MDVASVAIVVAALCVNFGWQPFNDDPQAYEVLMQVEPELVDTLKASPQLAIESHVPASITPIRNIRVVVGNEELPRTPIASTTKTKSNDRVVRGQEPAPIERTANFQSDDGWSGDRYAQPGTSSSRQYDQRGATIGSQPIRTAEANPWSLDGAQQAAADAGNSLRNSASSTAQQLNQQGQQLIDSAQNASRDFGQELQNMSGFGGQPSTTSAAASGSSAKRWSAPPPLASPQTTTAPPLATAPAGGAITPESWTSIRPELAPPRLATPPLPNGVRVASNPTTTRATSGPAFPAPPMTVAPPLHSVLTDSAVAKNTAEEDWASVWGTGSSSISGADVGGVGLEPVPPRPRSTVANSPPAASTNDRDVFERWPTTASTPATISGNPTATAPTADDRYRPATNDAADTWANFGAPEKSSNDQRASQPLVGQPNPQIAASAPPISTRSPSSTPGTQVVSGEEVPWKPLLGVSLALAGSVGANFFLGMSYADARRRYRSLVAKTTHAFQKEAGIAA